MKYHYNTVNGDILVDTENPDHTVMDMLSIQIARQSNVPAGEVKALLLQGPPSVGMEIQEIVQNVYGWGRPRFR